MESFVALSHVFLATIILLLISCVFYFSLPVSKPPDPEFSALTSKLIPSGVSPWGLIRCDDICRDRDGEAPIE